MNRFYVGDACYVVEGDEWDSLMEQVFGDGDEADYSKAPFFMATTAWGDGCFPLFEGDTEIGALCVDSGTLSAIPLSSLPKVDEDRMDRLGHIIEIESVDSSTFREVGGVFHFGEFRCHTG
jgi:hypothetical protein